MNVLWNDEDNTYELSTEETGFYLGEVYKGQRTWLFVPADQNAATPVFGVDELMLIAGLIQALNTGELPEGESAKLTATNMKLDLRVNPPAEQPEGFLSALLTALDDAVASIEDEDPFTVDTSTW